MRPEPAVAGRGNPVLDPPLALDEGGNGAALSLAALLALMDKSPARNVRVGVSVATYPRTPGFRFCYPVRSEPCSSLCKIRPLGRQVTQREQVLRCRWHLWVLSLERVTQPGRKQCFSTHVDPGSAPSGNPSNAGFLVEPPGTAPGSAVPIAHRNSSPSPAETGKLLYRVLRLNGK